MNSNSVRFTGLYYEVHGGRRLRSSGPSVIVLNHQHSIDVLALFHLWPEVVRCTTLAKRELLYFTGPFGWVAWLGGTTFINRKKSQVRSRGERMTDKYSLESITLACIAHVRIFYMSVKRVSSFLKKACFVKAVRPLQESREILHDVVSSARSSSTSVAVFPEGTRHHTRGRRDLLPFKLGAFAAAIHASVPVVPVVISHYHFLDAARGVMETGRVSVRVLEPVDSGRYAGNAALMAKEVREKMLKVLREEEGVET